MLRQTSGILLAVLLSGCELFPLAIHRPVILNPFPELSRVAIAPFINLSDEPTVDGHEIAKAYFAELQATPGFEVVPLSVTETAMRQYGLDLNAPADARRLAQILGVDAVVVGAVTDYSPYYPPRLGLHVQWWAADLRILPIPAGYGLPWGTPQEEFIPDSLVFEAQMASARAELARGAAEQGAGVEELVPPATTAPDELPPLPADSGTSGVPSEDEQQVMAQDFEHQGAEEPPDEATAWPAFASASSEQRGCVRPGPWLPPAGSAAMVAPVLSHTRIYQGHDADLTEALATYSYSRNDARFGGWEAYLQRSDDFIRFCCQLHISEMLSARGGAGKTRVVWQWPHSR